MKYIYVGKIVNTHGIKGELRLISKFTYKDKVFKKDNSIYIGNDQQTEIITGYRKHKMFDMITLNNYNNINQVLKFVGEKVYVDRDTIKLAADEYLDEELSGLNVIDGDKIVGKVSDIYETGKNNKVLEAIINEKKVLIPYNKEFIKAINLAEKTIEIKFIKGMIT